MGVAFCVVFKKEVPPYGTLGGDSKALVEGYAELDAFAEKNGLRTLGSLLSQDPEEMAALMEVDAEEMGLRPEEWFSASEGLAVVRPLIALLREHPKAVAKGRELLSDLEQVETELAEAARRRVKFHFSLVL
jgi:hypothetical protein